MVRYYLVKGRVQGVGFRWFVHREAAALDLRGWVRNTESGHVEVVAAGEEADPRSACARCWPKDRAEAAWMPSSNVTLIPARPMRWDHFRLKEPGNRACRRSP